MMGPIQNVALPQERVKPNAWLLCLWLENKESKSPAMTVQVQFPDGVIRNVPGQLKTIQAGDDATSSFEQVPINCDALWIYERQGEQWVARRRAQRVTALRPPAEEWWRSIKQMAEDSANVSQAMAEPADASLEADVRSAA